MTRVDWAEKGENELFGGSSGGGRKFRAACLVLLVSTVLRLEAERPFLELVVLFVVSSLPRIIN
jgi:hypothetical protein